MAELERAFAAPQVHAGRIVDVRVPDRYGAAAAVTESSLQAAASNPSTAAAALAAAGVLGATSAVAAVMRGGGRRGYRRRRSKLHRRGVAVAQAVSDLDVPAAEAKLRPWARYGARAWEVHKFGGASLKTAELYRTCGDLLVSESKNGKGPGGKAPTAAIVSAAGGMTDALVSVVTAAVDDFEEACRKMEEAAARQRAIIMELVPGQPALTQPVFDNLERDVKGVKAMLTSASMMRGVPPQMVELVAGLGEVWSAQTLVSYLKFIGEKAEWVDARDVLIVEDTASLAGLGEKGQALEAINPMWEATEDKFEEWWAGAFGINPNDKSAAPMLIVTGFVCSTPAGRPTTLKRSGSDYSATIFAKVLGSCKVTMWKNVDGVYTADPRLVPPAFSIPSMTFDEAMELAYFGGQVLHPTAMVPCIDSRIPVNVRNVFNPTHPGTIVYGRGDPDLAWSDQETAEIDEKLPVKAITAIEKVTLVTLSGASFLGTPGIARRIMENLGNSGVNVILTSQGSSEHSISVAVDASDGPRAKQAIEQGFQLEIAKNEETQVTMREGASIMAIIGEGMKHFKGISGRLFNSLGRSKVNVVAIAQGASERNISVVVDRSQLARALRAAHDGFTLSDMTVAVGIIGTGKVGTELLRQLDNFQQGRKKAAKTPAMRSVKDVKLMVRAMCDENMLLTADETIPLKSLKYGVLDIKRWKDALEAQGSTVEELLKKDSDGKEGFHVEETDLAKMVDFMDSPEYIHKVIIDCTSSEVVASHYPDWLRRGLHIVTPNKCVPAGPLSRVQECFSELHSTEGEARFLYGAAVGAQMPVVELVQDLLQTGDRVNKITGVFSGTMSHIFNVLSSNDDVTFSQAAEQAVRDGLTEPLLTDDLSGLDSAQKTLIVARELGLKVELEDIQIESLLPPGFAQPDMQGSGSQRDEAAEAKILAAIRDGLDEQIAEKVRAAKAAGEKLYYVGEVDVATQTVSVGLKAFNEDDSPFDISEHELVFVFETDRYTKDSPLVVHGPGAGAEVTASGLFADILRLTTTLGD
eukprot:TRINITY_DN34623_c0_g1_i1.p1 TRINITY_DN34623_c0_g1~~TRINITY_DN34623_c0_g1_i1.p1  ORF type:complete len:1035 (-),score=318.15 TRINITY_DN34623_c0_g1_i1:131-3235(-)